MILLPESVWPSRWLPPLRSVALYVGLGALVVVLGHVQTAAAQSHGQPTSAWLLAGASVAAAPDAPPAKSSAEGKPEQGKEPAEGENPFSRRIPAPELDGGVDWINTSGPVALKDLRGKFVLLDFWTFCCINCMHILPELKKLEEAYPNELVVVGVHSAKFEQEEDSKNIAEAVQRYEIKHPVVNDARHAIWDRFGIRSWPTMLLIDPEGKAIYGRSGEFKADEIAELLKKGIPYYRQAGLLDEKPLDLVAKDNGAETALRFPGKIMADEPGKRLFIADSNHNRIVIARLDGTLIKTIGSGAIGAADGDFATATFNHPQGMALKGDTLYVADTENHLLRKVDLANGQVSTIAGLGHQAQSSWPGLDVKAAADDDNFQLPDRYVGKPTETALNSPWDLFIHGKDLYIAMAGPHQIWKMPLDESEIGPYAGNGREDIVDGPLLPTQPYEEGYASFAQPSGLASDGKHLFVADSEGSSIRSVPFDGKHPVTTVVGTAGLPMPRRLFTFGDVDGVGRKVRLQHPLGVAFGEGALYVADTYNNKIKKVNIAKQSVETIAGTGKASDDAKAAQDLDEPTGIAFATGKLYVADTNNHRIRTVDLQNGNRLATLDIKGLQPPKAAAPSADESASNGPTAKVAPVALKPEDGLVWLKVHLDLPEGYKVNPDAPMKYKLTAAGNGGPLDHARFGKSVRVDPPEQDFQIELPLAKDSGDENVEVTLDYYYCQGGPTGLCRAGSVTWAVPISISASAKASTGQLRHRAE